MSPLSPPRKPRNQDVRPREYLTETEVESLIDAAAELGRYGHRDATMILIAFRHGLRVSELIALRWDMVDLDAGLLHVTRLKHGVNAPHPLRVTDCNRNEPGLQSAHFPDHILCIYHPCQDRIICD